MAGLYAADGSWNVTFVSGNTLTGLHAADGSYNVITSPGNRYVGAYHPCGALWVTINTSLGVPIRAPDGSLYITNDGMPPRNMGQPVTVVAGINPFPPTSFLLLVNGIDFLLLANGRDRLILSSH